MFWKLLWNELQNMHQSISARKQKSTIKQIEISRVTNSIRAFLLSWHQTCSMEIVFLQHVSLQIHPGTRLAPVAALPVLQRSLKHQQHQHNPALPIFILHRSVCWKTSPERLQPQEAWQRKWAKMTQRSQNTKGMPNKGQIYYLLIEIAKQSVHMLCLRQTLQK